jgi:hypothetical protein
VSGRPVPVRELSVDELLRILALDPSDRLARGQLRALRRRLSANTTRRTPDRDLVEFMLTAEPAEQPAVAGHVHPMQLPGPRPKPRPFTTGDIEYLRTFEGVDPSTVSEDDARLLSELEVVAQSPTERRLVERVADPIRRHHDRLAEEAPLRAAIDATSRVVAFRSPPVESRVLPLLEDRLVAEARAIVERGLVGASDEVRERTIAAAENDARAQARGALTEVWRSAEEDRQTVRDAAQARLDSLAGGADPKSTKPAAPVPSAMDVGRQRAVDQMAAQPSAQDLVDRFADSRPVLGTLPVNDPTEPAAAGEPVPAA